MVLFLGERSDPIFDFCGHLLAQAKEENRNISQLSVQLPIEDTGVLEKTLKSLPAIAEDIAQDAEQTEKEVLKSFPQFSHVISQENQLSDECIAVDTTLKAIETKVTALLNAPELLAIRRLHSKSKEKMLVVETELSLTNTQLDAFPPYQALAENILQLNHELFGQLLQNDKIINSLLTQYSDLFLAESFINQLKKLSENLFRSQRTHCRADRFMKEVSPNHYNKFRENLRDYVSDKLMVEITPTSSNYSLMEWSFNNETLSPKKSEKLSLENLCSLHLNSDCQIVLKKLFQQNLTLSDLLEEQKIIINLIQNNSFTKNVLSDEIQDLILQIKPLIKRLKKEMLYIGSKLDYYRSYFRDICKEKQIEDEALEKKNIKELRQKLDNLFGRQELIYAIERIVGQSPTYAVMFYKQYSGVILDCMKKLSELGISAQVKTFEKGYLSSFYNATYIAIDGPLITNLEKFQNTQSYDSTQSIYS